MIADCIANIQEACRYRLTEDEIKIIKYKLAFYAQCALMDSSVAREAEEISSKYYQEEQDRDQRIKNEQR